MSKKITFILMKSKNNDTGRLYAMTLEGSKVLRRVSMKEDIPYKCWDKTSHRVKSNFPEYNRINQKIEVETKSFNLNHIDISDGDDNQCALLYMKVNLNKENIRKSTIRKYETILINFYNVLQNEFGRTTLPFALLRDITFVKKLKSEIRKSGKNIGKLKSNKGWFNYMSVFGSFVKDWNTNSGTQFPINTLSFT